MVRFICGFSSRHSVDYTILSSMNMLNVEDRVKQLRLNHVFNIFHDTAPSYVGTTLSLEEQIQEDRPDPVQI